MPTNYFYGVIVHITHLIKTGLIDQQFIDEEGRFNSDYYGDAVDERWYADKLITYKCCDDRIPADVSLLNNKMENAKYIFSNERKSMDFMNGQYIHLVEPIVKDYEPFDKNCEYFTAEQVISAKESFEKKFARLDIGDLSAYNGVGIHVISSF